MQNPYRAPDTEKDSQQDAELVALRRAHLHHEVSVQSIASFLLMGVLIAIISAFMRVMQLVAFGVDAEPTKLALDLLILGLHVPVIGVGIVLGGRIRGLEPRARIPALVVSVLMLPLFPIGTLFGFYFLYLVLSAKGKIVFSPEYGAVRLATPGMVYRTHWTAWAFLCLILGSIVATFVLLSR